MDAFVNKLGLIGARCGQSKYLNAIKNALQNFMPATVSGAIGVVWTNVLINSSTGLGAIFKLIMALKVLNPIFSAMQYATISSITIGVTMLVASEITEANGEIGAYPAVLGFILWKMVTPTLFSAKNLTASYIEKAGKSHAFKLADFIKVTGDAAKNKISADSFTCSGILSGYTAATGGKPMGAISQLLVIAISIFIYTLFFLTYEKYQANHTVEE